MGIESTMIWAKSWCNVTGMRIEEIGNAEGSRRKTPWEDNEIEMWGWIQKNKF